MNNKQKLDINLDSKLFKEYYYLKEELIKFCRKNNLQTSGSKIDLTERIYEFLKTGKKTYKKYNINKTVNNKKITIYTEIEKNLICSEKHRDFYKKEIGNNFSFNVIFQKWLKNNYGKTYGDSIKAYYQIINDKKKNKTTIDKQFEYNIYIRNFFKDNKGKKLNDAIKCWKYKKSIKGHNRYEKTDLEILKEH